MTPASTFNLRVAIALLYACGLGGCTSYRYQDATLHIIDAETNQPIPDALVTLDYWNDVTLIRPDTSQFRGDSKGLAVLRVGVWSGGIRAAPAWTVAAPGYLGLYEHAAHGKTFPDSVEPLKGHKLSAAVARLYREPRPSVTVVIPDSFRGVLRIRRVEADRWIQGSPGQREFRYESDQDGNVVIEMTPLLSRDLREAVSIIRLHIRTASGVELTRDWETFADPSRIPAETVAARYCPGLSADADNTYVIGDGEDLRRARVRAGLPHPAYRPLSER